MRINLSSDKGHDFSSVSQAFSRAAEHIRRKGEFTPDMMGDKAVKSLTNSLYNAIKMGVDTSVGEAKHVSEAALKAMHSDVFLFSGMKAFHEMKESSFLIKDQQGNLRSKEEFIEAAAKIDDLYNKRYLGVEYDYAVSSAHMAQKWMEIEADGDRYDLQYRTQKDDKVRPEHAELDGITLPPSDPFWDSFLPPNGWNCRCDVIQVIRGKYEPSDSAASIEKGNRATQGKAERFRFNPGKDERIFPKRHSYNIDKCATCKELGRFSLRSSTPDNELCAGCRVIRSKPTQDLSWSEKKAMRLSESNERIKEILSGTTIKTVVNEHNKTGEIRMTAKGLRAFLYDGHTKTSQCKWMLEQVQQNKLSIGSPKFEKLIDKPNKVKKEKMGFTGFNAYNFKFEGASWRFKTAILRDVYETPYCLYQTKKKP